MDQPLTTHQQAALLPDNQRLALEALLAGGDQAEAAGAARVSVRTLQRWLQDRVFVNALHQARSALWLEASSRLQARANHAVDTLQEVMDCDRPHARVMAARAVLTLGNKAFELETLYQRALEVERQLDEYHAPGGGSPGGGSPGGGSPAGVTHPSASAPAPYPHAGHPNAERLMPSAECRTRSPLRRTPNAERPMPIIVSPSIWKTRHQAPKHDSPGLPALLARRLLRGACPEGRHA